jgi:hypothetical protein
VPAALLSLFFLTSADNVFARSEAIAGPDPNLDSTPVSPPVSPPVFPPPNLPLPLPGPIPASSGIPGSEDEAAELLPGESDPSILRKLPLSDFSLSAIVVARNPENNIAMLEHEGIGYTVKKGARIGDNDGVVKEITATSVFVEERGPAGDPRGGNVVELRLPR